jgi:hypothetical protein
MPMPEAGYALSESSWDVAPPKAWQMFPSQKIDSHDQQTWKALLSLLWKMQRFDTGSMYYGLCGFEIIR